MSTAAQEAKAKALKIKAKYSTRVFNRCAICGRARSYHGYFDMCRICLRDKAHYGDIPGLKKYSW
jgi:small subunit ribosomal protein S14